VTAWIDEGVAPLVVALNRLERIETLDSCEDDTAYGAYVFFRYRGGSRQATQFAADLAAVLVPYEADADYLLSAEWRPGTDEPIFRLACPASHIDRLACALSGAYAPAHDIFGRGLRSYRGRRRLRLLLQAYGGIQRWIW
jgi:hypothetical protein